MMDPEELQSIADANGLPVQHFDGYSVVDHPVDGPTVIAHAPGSRVPVASPPPSADRVPPLLARPPAPPSLTPPESIATTPQQQRADSLRRQGIEQRQAYDAEQDRLSHERELTYIREAAPDQFGIVTRTRPDGHTERIGPPGAFEAERAAHARRAADLEAAARRTTPTSAGVRTFPDGSTVTTDDQGRSLPLEVPSEVPRSWLAPTMEDNLRGGAREAMALDRGMSSGATVPQEALAAPGVTSVPSTPGAAPTLPGAPPPRARSGGGARPQQPAPMTLPGALDQLAGTPQARQAFDGTIAGLAQDPRDGGHYDAAGRQMLLEQQRAGLASKAAGTQAQIEQQAEQQRQQLEQDRQAAVRGAQQRYQQAIQRVSDAHLDPSRWFRDQGAAGTVTATIAVALGALGQAFSGSSTNSALDQINQAIDRDMTAQQSEIDAARAGADLTGNMLSITRQEFSDQQAAQDAARAAMLQQAALHVQEMEGSLAGQEAQNNAEAMRAQLAQQAAEAQAAAEERQSQIDLRHAQTLRELGNARQAMTRADRMENGGGGAAPFHATAPMFQTFEAALASGFPREQAALLAGFPPGITPEHSGSTTEQRGAIDALDASLGQLESIAGQGDIPGVGLFDSRLPGPEGRLVRDEISNAQDLIGRLRSGGAISDQEAGNFSAILGAGEWQTEDQFRAGLARVRRDLDARLGRTGAQGSAPDREHAAVGFTPG